jgi:hypothetical protein
MQIRKESQQWSRAPGKRRAGPRTDLAPNHGAWHGARRARWLFAHAAKSQLGRRSQRSR